MEYSVAKTISGFSSAPIVVKGSHLVSTPSKDYVNPGVGASISMFSYLIPSYSKNFLEIQKQIEPGKL